jgi:hypothetical protein
MTLELISSQSIAPKQVIRLPAERTENWVYSYKIQEKPEVRIQVNFYVSSDAESCLMPGFWNLPNNAREMEFESYALDGFKSGLPIFYNYINKGKRNVLKRGNR